MLQLVAAAEATAVCRSRWTSKTCLAIAMITAQSIVRREMKPAVETLEQRTRPSLTTEELAPEEELLGTQSLCATATPRQMQVSFTKSLITPEAQQTESGCDPRSWHGERIQQGEFSDRTMPLQTEMDASRQLSCCLWGLQLTPLRNHQSTCSWNWCFSELVTRGRDGSWSTINSTWPVLRTDRSSGTSRSGDPEAARVGAARGS